MNRFFVPSEKFNPPHLFLEKQQIKHITQVLRLKEGDKFIVFIEKGKEYIVEILSCMRDKIDIKVIDEKDIQTEPIFNVTLCQAIPKGQKMDEIVKFTTEIGIKKIIPFMSERTIPKISQESSKIKRWKNIAISAAQQSGRGISPEIFDIQQISDLKQFILQNDLSLLLSEKTQTPIKDILRKYKNDLLKNILYIIGPEGALTDEEENFLMSCGAIPVSLGKRILRVETASVVALAIILYEME